LLFYKVEIYMFVYERDTDIFTHLKIGGV